MIRVVCHLEVCFKLFFYEVRNRSKDAIRINGGLLGLDLKMIAGFFHLHLKIIRCKICFYIDSLDYKLMNERNLLVILL